MPKMKTILIVADKEFEQHPNSKTILEQFISDNIKIKDIECISYFGFPETIWRFAYDQNCAKMMWIPEIDERCAIHMSDCLIAFWNEKKETTNRIIKIAKNAGKTIKVCFYNKQKN